MTATTTGPRLSRRVQELPASQTLALAARAKALAAEGKPVISFSAGEPDFTSPSLVGEAAKSAIDAGDTHYPPVPGTAALRQAVVAMPHRTPRCAKWWCARRPGHWGWRWCTTRCHP